MAQGIRDGSLRPVGWGILKSVLRDLCARDLRKEDGNGNRVPRPKDGGTERGPKHRADFSAPGLGFGVAAGNPWGPCATAQVTLPCWVPFLSGGAESCGDPRPPARATGDFFKDPHPEAELYVLARVLHDWSDARCARLLARIRRACKPGSSWGHVSAQSGDPVQGPCCRGLVWVKPFIEPRGVHTRPVTHRTSTRGKSKALVVHSSLLVGPPRMPVLCTCFSPAWWRPGWCPGGRGASGEGPDEGIRHPGRQGTQRGWGLGQEPGGGSSGRPVPVPCSRPPVPVTGGAVLVIESLLDADGRGPLTTQLYSLNMLVQTEGRERTPAQYLALLGPAGFRDVQYRRTGGLYDVILGRTGLPAGCS